MCSTPFDITDYIGERLPAIDRLFPVLNAFRHHGLYRPDDLRRSCSIAAVCSTPFGITDYIGAVSYSLEGADYMCSTPFGITEYIGRRDRSRSRSSRTSAQRLSASRNISDEIDRIPYLAPGCAQRLSASRNISAADRGAAAQPLQHVLNAFRHHGIYRMVPPARSSSRSCAQRLSTSRNISVDGARRAGRVQQMCSTPFGITEYIGRGGDGHVGVAVVVLNAFRHHGIYRRGARSRGRFPAPVLNAFRHHGIYRLELIPQQVSPTEVCSTPFGITEYIGRP